MAHTRADAALHAMLADHGAPESLLRWLATLPAERLLPFRPHLAIHPGLPEDLLDAVLDAVPDFVAVATVFARQLRAGTPARQARELAEAQVPKDDPQLARQMMANAARFAFSPLMGGPDREDVLTRLVTVDDLVWLGGFADTAERARDWPAVVSVVRAMDRLAWSTPARQVTATAAKPLAELARNAEYELIGLLPHLTHPLVAASALETTDRAVSLPRTVTAATLVDAVLIPIVSGTAPGVTIADLALGPHRLSVLSEADWQRITDAAREAGADEDVIAAVVALATDYAPRSPRELRLSAVNADNREHGRWLVEHAPHCRPGDWAAFAELLDSLDETLTLADAMATFTTLTAT